MSGAMKRLTVGVHELRKGMYVAEPDRPWTDLPFPLQGFTIRTEREIRILREYCEYVYIDPERCADSVRERDLQSIASMTKRPSRRRRRAPRPDDDGLDESRRYPDPEPLTRQVEATSRDLTRAKSFVRDVFETVSQGEDVDVPAAGTTVGELIDRLTRNPTASLLLTSLNDRDAYTSAHSVNVCVLVLAFCLRAQLDERRLEKIGLGTLLHDVGKARLPAELLNRPGPLSRDEWRIVKRHPIESERILAASGRVSRRALNIARMHHERRDGRGYPDGLAKEQIPGYVLVAALVNRYHSLTSPRPYRSAVAPDGVLQSFYSNADDLYGSRATEAFIRSVGIYPMGSVVELDNGALGVVVSSRPSARLRPTVQLVRTPDGEPYEKLVLLNLAAEAERRESANDEAPVRMVRRVRSPPDSGIDSGAVIAETFGLQVG